MDLFHVSNSSRIFSSRNTSFSLFEQDFDYLYEGFAFERPIYLFVWQVLAFITVVENMLVVTIFLRRAQRTCTNRILIAIATVETLSVVVTVPPNIYVYQQLETGIDGASDVYVLSREWCRAFMFSKLFLSHAFHTASVWLHCLLCFLRFISVLFPLRSPVILSRTRIFRAGVVLCLIAPLVHVYHVVNEKAADDFMCVWRLEKVCAYGCAYLWYSMLLVHVLPCLSLFTMSGMLLRRLFLSTAKMFSKGKDRASMHQPDFVLARRDAENKTVTKVVVSAVVVLLIPEVPCTILLAYNVALRHQDLNILSLKTNRALQASYKLLLAISYCANFWVYVVLNKTFRREVRTLLRMKR